MEWINNPNRISRIELGYKCKTCDIAKALAKDDFKKNKYRVIFWGLLESSVTEELMNVLASDYKIQSVGGGCVRFPELECYDNEMKFLLSEKFGDCFYENATDKARENIRERLVSQNK